MRLGSVTKIVIGWWV